MVFSPSGCSSVLLRGGGGGGERMDLLVDAFSPIPSPSIYPFIITFDRRIVDTLGNTKFGLNFLIFAVHPMRLGGIVWNIMLIFR